MGAHQVCVLPRISAYLVHHLLEKREKSPEDIKLIVGLGGYVRKPIAAVQGRTRERSGGTARPVSLRMPFASSFKHPKHAAISSPHEQKHFRVVALRKIERHPPAGGGKSRRALLMCGPRRGIGRSGWSKRTCFMKPSQTGRLNRLGPFVGLGLSAIGDTRPVWISRDWAHGRRQLGDLARQAWHDSCAGRP